MSEWFCVRAMVVSVVWLPAFHKIFSFVFRERKSYWFGVTWGSAGTADTYHLSVGDFSQQLHQIVIPPSVFVLLRMKATYSCPHTSCGDHGRRVHGEAVIWGTNKHIPKHQRPDRKLPWNVSHLWKTANLSEWRCLTSVLNSTQTSTWLSHALSGFRQESRFNIAASLKSSCSCVWKEGRAFSSPPSAFRPSYLRGLWASRNYSLLSRKPENGPSVWEETLCCSVMEDLLSCFVGVACFFSHMQRCNFCKPTFLTQGHV